MSTENLQQLQNENYLTKPQISEGNDEQQVEEELMEATVLESHCEQTQEILQENIKPEIKLKGNQCITVTPCPTGSPLGCLVCF